MCLQWNITIRLFTILWFSITNNVFFLKIPLFNQLGLDWTGLECLIIMARKLFTKPWIIHEANNLIPRAIYIVPLEPVVFLWLTLYHICELLVHWLNFRMHWIFNQAAYLQEWLFYFVMVEVGFLQVNGYLIINYQTF